MKTNTLRIAACLIGIFALNGAALADKPSWAGKGDAGKQHARDVASREQTYRFGADERRVIGDYYGQRARAGHCPPGLAKKHNGCLPPGQAKKWAVGQPLPPDLRYYDLPRTLLSRLPPPPPQHRYVQVAGDVLLIAVGTSMVVDAIEDITR